MPARFSHEGQHRFVGRKPLVLPARKKPQVVVRVLRTLRIEVMLLSMGEPRQRARKNESTVRGALECTDGEVAARE